MGQWAGTEEPTELLKTSKKAEHEQKETVNAG